MNHHRATGLEEGRLDLWENSSEDWRRGWEEGKKKTVRKKKDCSKEGARYKSVLVIDMSWVIG